MSQEIINQLLFSLISSSFLPKIPQISPFLNSFQFLSIEKKKGGRNKTKPFSNIPKTPFPNISLPVHPNDPKKKNKSTNQSPSKEIPQTIQSAPQFPPFHYVIIIPETTTPYFPPRPIRTGLLSLSISIAPETDDERRANIEA